MRGCSSRRRNQRHSFLMADCTLWDPFGRFSSSSSPPGGLSTTCMRFSTTLALFLGAWPAPSSSGIWRPRLPLRSLADAPPAGWKAGRLDGRAIEREERARRPGNQLVDGDHGDIAPGSTELDRAVSLPWAAAGDSLTPRFGLSVSADLMRGRLPRTLCSGEGNGRGRCLPSSGSASILRGSSVFSQTWFMIWSCSLWSRWISGLASPFQGSRVSALEERHFCTKADLKDRSSR
mmetsp:Transcript_100784/g.285701  ORF Transcript_100784/g.285701 Transcript_100784/m.285701 type:complete len:234 (+) Transcript_100784:556-1257(+)